MLNKVVSGGQSGVDQSALVVAKRFGLKTGGIMPHGYKTLEGPRPDIAALYGLSEHTSESYIPRTYQNVCNSDGTVRLAGNLLSRGEVCTLKAIKTFAKPHFDVDLTDPPPVSEFCDWLREQNISTLNVAGNAEQTYSGAFAKSEAYLTKTFFKLSLQIVLTEKELLKLLGFDVKKRIFSRPSLENSQVMEFVILQGAGS